MLPRFPGSPPGGFVPVAAFHRAACPALLPRPEGTSNKPGKGAKVSPFPGVSSKKSPMVADYGAVQGKRSHKERPSQSFRTGLFSRIRWEVSFSAQDNTFPTFPVFAALPGSLCLLVTHKAGSLRVLLTRSVTRRKGLKVTLRPYRLPKHGQAVTLGTACVPPRVSITLCRHGAGKPGKPIVRTWFLKAPLIILWIIKFSLTQLVLALCAELPDHMASRRG